MRDLMGKLFLKIKGQEKVRILTDKKQEALIKLGKEQFQKLVKQGLSIPVMTL